MKIKQQWRKSVESLLRFLISASVWLCKPMLFAAFMHCWPGVLKCFLNTASSLPPNRSDLYSNTLSPSVPRQWSPVQEPNLKSPQLGSVLYHLSVKLGGCPCHAMSWLQERQNCSCHRIIATQQKSVSKVLFLWTYLYLFVCLPGYACVEVQNHNLQPNVAIKGGHFQVWHGQSSQETWKIWKPWSMSSIDNGWHLIAGDKWWSIDDYWW